MTSCVHLDSVEDLVIGTITPAHARELRAHLDGCEECALEHAMLVEERALFTRRAAVAPALPKLTLPEPSRPHAIVGVARRAMRSQALPALAAAVCLFAGVSRMGTSSSASLALPEPHAAQDPIASVEVDPPTLERANISYRPSEPLSCATDDTSAACLANVRAIAIAPAFGNDPATCEGDDGAMSRGLSSMCELSVTSSMSRQ